MDNNSEVVYLYLDDIIPNRFQPREVFDDQALKELAVSIKEHGVIQPIIVRKVENKYEIIAGERRYKASTMAGLTKIPAIVKNLDDKESSKVALIENLQRKDLSPIEEARTYQKILELEDSMTQEQLAATLGKTQSSVSNKLRLLALPDEVQDALLKEKISERHARSLLNIEDKNDQIKMMDKVIAEKMTVRELDKEIKVMKGEIPEISEAPDVPQVTPETSPDIPNLSLDEINSPSLDTQPETTPEIKQDFVPASFEFTTPPTEAPATTPFVDVNPTSVDINKIRESSVDIHPTTTPVMEVKDLLKSPSDDEFKFVPSFGDSSTSTEAPKNEFAQFFTTNTNVEPTTPSENTSFPSLVATPEISVPSPTPLKDVTKAVDGVKEVITKLQNEGYNVSFEDSDNPDEYKITINIKKN